MDLDKKCLYWYTDSVLYKIKGYIYMCVWSENISRNIIAWGIFVIIVNCWAGCAC